MYAVVSLAAAVAVLMILTGLDGQAAEEHPEHKAIETAPAPKDLPEPPAPRVTTSASRWNPLAAFMAAYHALDERLTELARIDEENQRLKKQVAQLELANERLSLQLATNREERRSEELKAESVAEGGVPTARTIASLHVSDKSLLASPPEDRFDGALDAFNEGDFETAGRALASLVDDPRHETYHTAQAYFLTGVSLYKVGNFKRALAYFARSEESAAGDDVAYAPRALAWKSLCFGQLGRKKDASATIRQLIQKYPRSPEARRLNRNA